MQTDSEADRALLALLHRLRALDYSFVTVTPASHARVLARRKDEPAATLRDVLGWSLPFRPSSLDPEVEALLENAGVLRTEGDRARATVRVSSLGETLFIHSAYPTDRENAVFFGPDSYRFAQAIEAELSARPLKGGHIVDIGAGGGVGGIVAALHSRAARITLTDVNTRALRMARVNAQFAGVGIETIEADTLDQVDDPIDLALANPPYIMDERGRAYRDGGDLYGGGTALQMAHAAAERLAPGGRFLLYTGAAIVGGRNPLSEALCALAEEYGLSLSCRETDPDVFGEELAGPAYAKVERIAVIVATFERSSGRD